MVSGVTDWGGADGAIFVSVSMFAVSTVGVSSSKFMSENTGANDGVASTSSKLFGNGNSPAGCNSGGAGVFDVLCGAVMLLMSNTDFGAAPPCARARTNAGRNSVGIIFCGVVSVGVVSTGSCDTGSGAAVADVSSGTGCINFGSDSVNNGFFVRKMILVVAMYNGIAANINMPNTKPGKPRRWA